jgi:hypothetical protein
LFRGHSNSGAELEGSLSLHPHFVATVKRGENNQGYRVRLD